MSTSCIHFRYSIFFAKLSFLTINANTSCSKLFDNLQYTNALVQYILQTIWGQGNNTVYSLIYLFLNHKSDIIIILIFGCSICTSLLYVFQCLFIMLFSVLRIPGHRIFVISETGAFSASFHLAYAYFSL